MTAPAPPIAYAQWSAWFDALEAGGADADLLERASAGRMTWTAGVAELLGDRMMAALNKRLDAIGKTLERRLQRVAGETELLSALVNARREFGQLRRFGALDCIPDLLRRSMDALITHHVDSRQQALEKSARTDRSGRLLYLVGRNRLDTPAAAPPPPPAAQAGSPEPMAQSRPGAPRRILLS